MATKRKRHIKSDDDWKGEAMRDWYATHALQGMLASPPPTLTDRFSVDKDGWARIAYEWADAMVKARRGR